MTLATLVRLADRYTRDLVDGEPTKPRPDALPGLGFYRRTAPTSFESAVYDPIVCLILQGRKETTIGDRQFSVRAGQCIIVSHDLPVMSRIVEASPTAPYLAMIARLDISELRNLHDEVPAPLPDEPSAYAVSDVDDRILDVMVRYAALVDEPTGVGVLAPLVRRELHFRLLTASNGAMLRTLLRRDSHASHISRAIERLRADFREAIEVPELARSVGMSPSSFHRHFKLVTATTPLQYQKDLRLTEARRLLMTGDHSVSTAAFEVGYESTTQFSREYSRKYGVPPSEALRRGMPQTVTTG